MRDDSASEIDTQVNVALFASSAASHGRTGFEHLGRNPLELDANVRKVLGMNPIDTSSV